MPRLILFALLSAALISAQPAASLSGRVTDTDGQPVSKVTLELKPAAPEPGKDSRAWRVQSSEQGGFRFEGVEPGSYTLSAAKSGFLPWNFGATRANPAPSALHLIAGKPQEGVSVRMAPAAAISGKILDEDGDPVPAYVEISRERFENGVRKLVAVTGAYPDLNSEGRYRISGLAPGRYFVLAQPQSAPIPFLGGGYATVNGALFLATPVNAAAQPQAPKTAYVNTFFPNAAARQDAKPVDLTARQEATGVDIRMRKADVFTIRGRLDGAVPEHPSDQYRIVLAAIGRTTGVGGPLPLNVTPDGSFEITGVPSGDYDLLVANSGLTSEPPLAFRRLEVRNHDSDGVVVHLGALAAITGTIALKENRKPAAGVSVTLTSLDDAFIKVQSEPSKETGQFRLIEIPAGNYRVSLSGVPPDTYLASDGILEVAPGAAIDPLVLTLAPAGRLLGSASPYDTITLIPDPHRPDHSDRYRLATADGEGHFDLRGIAPGAYRAFAWNDIEPGAWFDAEFLKPHINQSVPVIIREGAVSEIKLTEIAAP